MEDINMNKNISGGVNAAKGFMANGLNAGIKNNVKKDMALVYSEKPCVAAGVFTTNKVKAAPVKWDYNVVHNSPYAQAVVINSGVANACTGEEGYGYCMDMAEAVGNEMQLPKDAVLVASTGVIGRQLPMDIIKEGIKKLPKGLKPDEEAATLAAEAIMTTDTKSKQVAVNFEIDGKVVTVGGMCKGSGMIHPNMATMLCFITTDCMIKKDLLQKALSEIVNDTFNMISVDGDTSTNDSVLLLANGMAENKIIDTEDENYKKFYEALYYIMEELSKKIAGDGEGCTCLFEVRVLNALTKEDAKTMAKSVVCSSLTKAAIYGHDANWGRILCAMGYSGAEFDPELVDIYFESACGRLQIVKDGRADDYSEEEATKILSEDHVIAICDCKQGTFNATAYGCDLTHEYVNINADYRS
ncbi:bifunctional glutamate N-acetyltransferase/amino-acid acetyltransferase ArgJ [Eshraghiella crossota]|jgi:glutamate N-acetyltransferase/amino-acid N-acetyltransferase|uniref:bifunctional glutamate N-acetyltransferase/amino-acid acetyltransferase ArgJ n=1 Tax=Eshraghiella crossota TaxID=45851 RepID=UPI000E7E341F|nr:bifunctional glutamate N-acetyltransferase/amino-acid acetyltransferase ArgJ [Butyrivibrio sp.]HAX08070.1 ornithine acetyltransferase [Butyrivibrio sp.]